MTHPHKKKSRLHDRIERHAAKKSSHDYCTNISTAGRMDRAHGAQRGVLAKGRKTKTRALWLFRRHRRIIASLSLQMIRGTPVLCRILLYPDALFYQSLPPPFHWTKADLEPLRPPFVQAERFTSRMSLVITSVRPFGLLYQEEWGVPVKTKKEPPPGGILCHGPNLHLEDLQDFTLRSRQCPSCSIVAPTVADGSRWC